MRCVAGVDAVVPDGATYEDLERGAAYLALPFTTDKLTDAAPTWAYNIRDAYPGDREKHLLVAGQLIGAALARRADERAALAAERDEPRT